MRGCPPAICKLCQCQCQACPLPQAPAPGAQDTFPREPNQGMVLSLQLGPALGPRELQTDLRGEGNKRGKDHGALSLQDNLGHGLAWRGSQGPNEATGG